VGHTIDGKLHGLDAATGEKRWQYDNNPPVLSFRGTSSPIVTRTVAISAFDNGKIVALRPDNGIGLWEQRVAVPKGSTDLERVVDIDGAPIIIGDLVFVASYQGQLMAISRSTGRPLWARDISTYQGISSNGSAVFVTEDGDTIAAFDFGSGDSVWRNEQMLRRSLTGPAYLRGHVVVADDDGYLHVLDPESGDYLGNRKVDGSGVRSPLVVMGDKLLVLDNDGTLHAVSVTAL
jgi:outer membrane protein assembly factor BamB